MTKVFQFSIGKRGCFGCAETFSARLKLGDHAYYQAALRDLSRAHELKPSHRGVVAQLALVYEKLGDDDQALSFLQMLEAMPP